MKTTRMLSVLSFALCMVLIAAMALFATGCSDNDTETPTSPATVTHVRGEGATVFTFTVTDKDGVGTAFEIHTNKTTVGDALLELGLIAGEAGPFGLYVKTVNGLTLDYDKDKAYWAFYENGAYAVSGVDTTDITPGATYSFRAEK